MNALATFPFPPVVQLRRELNRLFDGVMGSEDLNTRPFPALNLWEDGENLYAEAEVPGLALSDLEILVQGNELTIKGERKPFAQEPAMYHRQERGTGQFARFVTLPSEIDAEKVDAALTNGVLTIRLPKSARAKARRITVRAS